MDTSVESNGRSSNMALAHSDKLWLEKKEKSFDKSDDFIFSIDTSSISTK